MQTRNTLPLCLFLIAVSFTVTSCFTVGRKFPVNSVSQIRMGETTKDDVEQLFGTPWRTGIEDGKETWTYGRYRYALFGGTSTCDLVVRFNNKDVVISYSFNTTE